MLHVRALIKADSVIVFDPAGSSDSTLKERLLWHLQGNLKALANKRGREKERKLVAWQGRKEDEDGKVIRQADETTGENQDGKAASCEEGLGLSYEHR